MLDYINQTHEAQGVVEYSLILLLVAIAALGTVQLLGPLVTGLYNLAEQAFP